LLLGVEDPVFGEVAVADEGAEGEDGLSAGDAPPLFVSAGRSSRLKEVINYRMTSAR
jgi:hypothetical protein